MNTLVITCGALIVLAGCAPSRTRPVTIVPLFGPAMAREAISGRADGPSGTSFLVGGKTIVHIDLVSRDRTEVQLRSGPTERFWGLARLSDGTLWSLNADNALVRIATDGGVIREADPRRPYLGVFSRGDRLVLQRGRLSAGAPAMVTMRPDGREEQPWSGMVVRGFDGLMPGAITALNLVSCGTSERVEVPCWFPEEAAVSLIAADGSTRRMVLAGLSPIAPAALLEATVPSRPIRDVFVERGGTIWVLAGGQPPVPPVNLPGGWILARYSLKGDPIDRRTLPEPVRAILRAGSGRAVVLTGAGMIAEVQP